LISSVAVIYRVDRARGAGPDQPVRAVVQGRPTCWGAGSEHGRDRGGAPANTLTQHARRGRPDPRRAVASVRASRTPRRAGAGVRPARRKLSRRSTVDARRRARSAGATSPSFRGRARPARVRDLGDQRPAGRAPGRRPDRRGEARSAVADRYAGRLSEGARPLRRRSRRRAFARCVWVCAGSTTEARSRSLCPAPARRLPPFDFRIFSTRCRRAAARGFRVQRALEPRDHVGAITAGRTLGPHDACRRPALTVRPAPCRASAIRRRSSAASAPAGVGVVAMEGAAILTGLMGRSIHRGHAMITGRLARPSHYATRHTRDQLRRGTPVQYAAQPARGGVAGAEMTARGPAIGALLPRRRRGRAAATPRATRSASVRRRRRRSSRTTATGWRR